MITFESGELEIALITYNHCKLVKDWLTYHYEEMRKRNIHFSIYDSSTNDDTETYIKQFIMSNNDSDLEYHRIDSDIIVGYKALLPLLQSESKYVCVAADSRYWDYAMLDREIFPHLKQNVDCTVIYVSGDEEQTGKIYTNMQQFITTAFTSINVIGTTIYKTSLFEPLKNNIQLRTSCDRKYKNNAGYGWMGYCFEMLLSQGRTAAYAYGEKWVDLRKDEDLYTWSKRYYHCVIEDLLGLLDGLADQLPGTDVIAKDYWNWFNLDSPQECYYAKKFGDLTPETYMHYKENGMLDRCSEHTDRLQRFAYMTGENLDGFMEREMQILDQQFGELCRQNINKIQEASKGRKLWIYGAGSGGKILAECLAEYDIPIYGFLDRQAEQLETCMDIPVKTVDTANLEDAYVVISMRNFTSRCIVPLLKAGVARNYIFYPIIDS